MHDDILHEKLVQPPATNPASFCLDYIAVVSRLLLHRLYTLNVERCRVINCILCKLLKYQVYYGLRVEPFVNGANETEEAMAANMMHKAEKKAQKPN